MKMQRSLHLILIMMDFALIIKGQLNFIQMLIYLILLEEICKLQNYKKRSPNHFFLLKKLFKIDLMKNLRKNICKFRNIQINGQ